MHQMTSRVRLTSHHCAFERDTEAPGDVSLHSSNTFKTSVLRNRSQSYQYECTQMGKSYLLSVFNYLYVFGCSAMLAQYIMINAFVYAY